MKQDKIVAFLIRESTTTDPNIKIISDSNQCVKINADLQDTSELNRNKRKYPTNVIRNGLQRENIAELIANKSWFGEAGHPIDPTVQRQMTVMQQNISHRILDYNFRGPIVNGTVKTAPTEMGRFMRDVILDGEDAMKSAFSLRAMGPVKETAAGRIVQDPLTIVTYDWVFFPSHRKAYQQAILGVTGNGNTNALTESASMIPLLEASAIDYIASESKNFKLISNLLEFTNKDALLSEDASKIILVDKDGNTTDKLVVGVEDYISHEITGYFGKFR